MFSGFGSCHASNEIRMSERKFSAKSESPKESVILRFGAKKKAAQGKVVQKMKGQESQ